MVMTADKVSVDVVYEAEAATASSGSGNVSGRLQTLLRQAESIQDGGEVARAVPDKPPMPLPEPASPAPSSSRSWWPFSRSDASAPPSAAVDGGSGSSSCETEEEEDEEETVTPDRIVLIVDKERPALQMALLLNAAKCSMMLHQWAAAIARAGRAERIAAHDTVDLTKALVSRRTALAVCARAALGMQRFGLATTYAARLMAAPMPGDAAGAAAAVREVRTLLRDIQKRTGEVRRSNRRLAKELSEWVEQAMETSGHAHNLATIQPAA